MRLQIEEMDYGGAGLAHAVSGGGARQTISIPFTLPGELVEAHLEESSHPATKASLLEILTPSESRVVPGCAHFGECGGCHYQHASYDAQIAIKTAILREVFEQAGLESLPEIQTHRSEPWRYRNRTRLRVELLDGQWRVGYSRRGTNVFLPIHECPISAPLIWRASQALLQVARESTAAGQCARQAAEVEFFVTGDESILQMTLFVRREDRGFTAFCVRMRELLPELTGAGSALLPKNVPQRQAQKPRLLSDWGAPGVNYQAVEEDYWITRGAFFQVNRFLLDDLVTTVTQDRSGLLAWDLYAGVGLFSRVLARSFNQVVAVEVAGDDLINTFKAPGQHAIRSTTLDFLQAAVVQRQRPQLIVMDPPRAGLGEEVCTLLGRISAAEMVYVSCDPVTLARDLKRLVAAGYRIVNLHLVDLFPQTFHLESVVVLRK